MEHTFDSIKIGLASPEMIRSWSWGEVTKPETINYRTQKPEKDGLFCDKIFGPTKDWECGCGRYKRSRHKGHKCEKCGVEVTTKKVRRERMGHIELACPVAHIWYSKANPSRMATFLDISPKAMENVIYFVQRIVTDPGDTPLLKYQVLTENEYQENYEKYETRFKAEMGAEAIKKLLAEIDVEELSKQLKEELEAVSGSSQKKNKLIKRLKIVEEFRKSGNRPEWMVLDVLPVLPPEIRPMVSLDGGRYAASDINDLYRRVINRNNRLKKLIELRTPDMIIKNEKRMLQEAVDALIDNSKVKNPVTGPNKRQLKSLSEMLRGKQGRFRQNLLGKRVDYSGRSVIVVGPNLKIYQCGLPREMALELFKPFVMKRLTDTQKAANIKEAKKKVEQVADEVWDALEVVIKDHPVLLNRAPTLHRLSIQAFEPVLVEGRAIKLHPLVCKAFNADFDGDQMPVHVPLSNEAQAEARFLMLSANNLLKPVDGKAIAVPSQDMVLGSYYLTLDPRDGEKGAGSVYRNMDEAIMAYENGDLELHAPIKIRVEKEIDGEKKTKVIDATLGRLIFNSNIPQDLGYVNRAEEPFALEINFVAGSKQLSQIVDRTIKIHGFTMAAEVLDSIKEMGYKYSTRASLSISVADMVIPEEKYHIVKEAEAQVDEIFNYYKEGELTDVERYNCVIDIWNKATNDVVAQIQQKFNKYNPIKMMSDSGARGSMTQMRQLAGMRGLMFSATGKTMEIPIKSNFREGLTILEYFVAARSARKSLSDTALKTADSGYLTRRLVDVSHGVIICEHDCGTRDYMVASDIKEGNEVVEKLADRILGRYTVEDVIDPTTGEVIVKENEMIRSEAVDKIVKSGITEVKVRSVLRCQTKGGVCAHCYGMDLATSKPVNIGEAVGVIAAQSIGEPGTQLTMRTFHTGGVASANITQGLPRVEELFEARRPKKPAIASEAVGNVEIVPDGKINKLVITDEETGKEYKYDVPFGTTIIVHDGDRVERGQALTEGYMYPNDILNINGIEAVYDYIVREVQKVYRSQNVDVDDKHVEVIARQMTRMVKIEDSGDADLIVGTSVDKDEFNRANEEVRARIAAGEVTLREAVGSPVLHGITTAASSTESFLSAASFQETTRALTDAAIRGKVDHLRGLKENVIIGKLIPAGTGLAEYNKIGVKKADK